MSKGGDERNSPAGDVLSPLDLLSYERAHETAMQRAFGGVLIARTEAAATALATRFGLASVDLEGRVSRPGSLQVRGLDLEIFRDAGILNKNVRRWDLHACNWTRHAWLLRLLRALGVLCIACRAAGGARQAAQPPRPPSWT
jgi:hypothetical protein